MTTTSEGLGDDWEPVPIHQFETESAAAYADLLSIWYDLNFVKDACVRLATELSKPHHDHDSMVIHGLWTAILTTYARCFISGKRKPLPKSDIQLLPIQGEVSEWHQFLIDMRHKHVAHSVNAFEAVRVGILLPPSNEIDGVAHMSMTYISTDPGGVEQTRSLVIALIQILEKRIKEQQDVVRQEAKVLGAKHISELPIMGSVVPGPEEAGRARA